MWCISAHCPQRDAESFNSLSSSTAHVSVGCSIKVLFAMMVLYCGDCGFQDESIMVVNGWALHQTQTLDPSMIRDQNQNLYLRRDMA